LVLAYIRAQAAGDFDSQVDVWRRATAPIVLTAEDESTVQVIAELVEVLDSGT
jgi:hypothetical protein